MNGQRQIFTFVVLIIFICTFSYFKNVIKRDKQLKLQRELETKIQLEEKLKKEMKKQLEKVEKHQRLLERMKEHYNICYNIHVLVLKPEKISINVFNETQKSIELTLKEKEVETPPKDETKTTGTPEAKLKNNVVSEPIIYLFLLVLIYSLIKAATDISQHFNKKQKEEDCNDRRKSLQEYAVKNEVKNVKAPLYRRSTVLGMEVRPKPFNKLLEERRLTRTIPGMNYSGLVTEPGTPAKISNGLAIKPSPLLRRCSVPAFMLHSMGHGSRLRRPSIDSFSEDDSSPDVKRRVRMIHRH